MTAVTWDAIGERNYETGLDHGVLYFPTGGGVAWNGLTSVNDTTSVTVEPIYFDGFKTIDIPSVGEFSATMKAYTYPDEFLEFEGVVEDSNGMLFTGQRPKPFHLSYRTRVGNDVQGIQDYKLHLLWNLLAVPSSKTFDTLSSDPSPIEFEWKLTSVPQVADTYRPTSHIILDSRKLAPALMDDIGIMLYGDVSNDPEFPSLMSLITFIDGWTP